MEKRASSIVFRRMSHADFRHINKVGGEEAGGGGQSYIDFPTNSIPLDKWFEFLGPNTGYGAGQRPRWDFTINSIGLNSPRQLKIYQRRTASVSIAAQKIHSQSANRVPAWHPDNSFPVDYNPLSDNLVIYIVRTEGDEYWAGWFLKRDVPKSWIVNNQLKQLFEEPSAGHFDFTSETFIDTENKEWPFLLQDTANTGVTEEEIEIDLLNQDISPKLQELTSEAPLEVKERIFRIRQRNSRIVKNLKSLYNGSCQITGTSLTFQKKNGEWYSEVHHLIPLGEQGSDSYANVIAVSPLIHRMLHYADVSEIDLSKIKDNKLKIKLAGTDYEITWHPEHFKTIEDSLAD